MTSRPNQPLFIVVRGLPGSGKTYMAVELRKKLGGDNVVMLDPDMTDYESAEYAAHVETQKAEGVDPALHAYRFLRAQAYQAIEDRKIFIWNQPFTNLEIFDKMMGRMRDQAAECKVELSVFVVEVQLDPAIALQRVNKRKQQGGHGPTGDARFQKFVDDYHSFAEHGYDTVTIQGDNDVQSSVATVMTALEKLHLV